MNSESNEDIETKVRQLINRDLATLQSNSIQYTDNDTLSKQSIKDSMSHKRNSIIAENKDWIKNHLAIGQQNLANGIDMLKHDINPVIEVCKSQYDYDLFRLFRYYWSSPYSEYVGRRIKLIIRDYALPTRPVIGIAALGSSIIHIPDRDKWIGWSKEIRTQNIVYTMDAYILGALPPYNLLLGGKLISYLLASNEVRDIYKYKYLNRITNVNKRIASDLACIFTTSLFGLSSQYNRISYYEDKLYIPIGETSGYGTFHFSDETFGLMLNLLNSKGINIKNRFENGPCWRMRVIKAAAETMNLSPKTILNHSHKRKIYVVPLAKNYIEYLNGIDSAIDYYDYPQEDLVEFWRSRWYRNRVRYLQDSGRIAEIINYRNEDFCID